MQDIERKLLQLLTKVDSLKREVDSKLEGKRVESK